MFSAPTLLLAIAEHKVPLPHGRTASQNDVWALVQTASGIVSVAIEGKAGEDFGQTVSDWLKKRNAGSSKEQRLRFLVDQERQWQDYVHFCSALGNAATRGSLGMARTPSSVFLFTGWMDCEPATEVALSSLERISVRVDERIGPPDPSHPDFVGRYTPSPPYTKT